jgi:uncharacterized protein (DUF608 family)
MGAINGMCPDGSVDTACDQSQEVWTGTTYGLAALMLHEGMSDEAWQTAWGRKYLPAQPSFFEKRWYNNEEKGRVFLTSMALYIILS